MNLKLNENTHKEVLMKETNMNPNAKLSFLERFAYGMGDYAGNLVYSAISAFLLVYYTNVVGASAAAAASIIAISKFFDGVSDLIVDHTHSKWGKARPWIARLCIPLAVCTVLMFTVPSSFAGSVQIAYMFLTYNLVSTVFYTGINVPYAAMHGLMTTNQYERSSWKLQKPSCYSRYYDDQYRCFKNDNSIRRWRSLHTEGMDSYNFYLNGSICNYQFL